MGITSPRVSQSINTPRTMATTTTKGTKAIYSRRKKALDPSRIASPMARTCSLPWSALSTRIAVKAANRRATPPATIARIIGTINRSSTPTKSQDLGVRNLSQSLGGVKKIQWRQGHETASKSALSGGVNVNAGKGDGDGKPEGTAGIHPL